MLIDMPTGDFPQKNVEPFSVWYENLPKEQPQVLMPGPEQTTPNKFSFALAVLGSLDHALKSGKMGMGDYKALLNRLVELACSDVEPTEDFIDYTSGNQEYVERNNHE